jgi:hypothetical protein
MVWTYNSFIDEINDNFASLHLQIKRFEIGFYDDMSVYITKNELWPIMWIVPIDIIHLKNSVSQYNLRVYFLDLLDNDNSNERDVLSDQLSISRDFINWLRLNEYSFDLLNDPTATPVKSIAMDYTAGWYVDVSLEVETEGSDCSIPFSGASGTQSGCPLSYVVNSDGSYSITLQSGETLQLPDISITSNGTFSQTIPAQTSYLIPDVNWTDSDGSIMSTPYGDGITCQVVADGNIEINGVFFDTVAPGATLSIPVIAIGGSPVGGIVGTDYIIGNSQPKFNGVNMDSIKAEDDKDYYIYLDGVLSGTGSVTTWNLTSNIPTPNTNAFLLKSGDTRNFGTGSDGEVQSGRLTSWLVLGENNMFGNTNRFTNVYGGSTFSTTGAGVIVLDHSTRSPLTGELLGYDKFDVTTARTWANMLTYANTKTVGGYSGWRLTSNREIFNIRKEGQAFSWDYVPFNYSSGLLDYVWTSTTEGITTTYAYLLFNYGGTAPLQSRDKTGSYFGMFCRTFTLTSGGVLT